jgi:hypothetical protein
VCASARGVEGVHEGGAPRIHVERVDEASVRARGAGDRRAVHHPAALRAVGDRAREQAVAVEVVRAHDVAVVVHRRDVLDQVEAARVRRERVEREVALERDRLVAERLRVDDSERAAIAKPAHERRLGEDERAPVAGEAAGRAVVGHERDAPASLDCTPAEDVAVAGPDRLEHGRVRAAERDVTNGAVPADDAVAPLVDTG